MAVKLPGGYRSLRGRPSIALFLALARCTMYDSHLLGSSDSADSLTSFDASLSPIEGVGADGPLARPSDDVGSSAGGSSAERDGHFGDSTLRRDGAADATNHEQMDAGGEREVTTAQDGGAGGMIDGGIDPNCLSSSTAKEGAACTKDCVVGCGFQNMGAKTCTCTTMIYSQCSCPRPPQFTGAYTADYCATPDGTTLTLKNTPCTTEWAECIGKDAVSGVTPQGCACLKDKLSGQLLWNCQSTNQWFRLAVVL